MTDPERKGISRRVRCLAISAGAVLAAALTAAPAGAATTSVPCGDVAALNAAITAANGTAEADTIEVTGAPCTFSLTTAAAPSAGNDTGLPIVTKPLTINGHGATIQRAASAPNFRILFAWGNPSLITMNVNDLIVAGGKLTGASQHGAGIAGLNAAITLDHVTLSANAATGSGAGGGGLLVSGGSAVVDHSNFQFNAAFKGGGMWSVNAPVTVRRSDFAVNGATSSTGAALIQGGTVLFENDTIASNTSPNGIGGIAVTDNGIPNPANVTVNSSTFANNSTNNAAGAPPGGSLWAGVFTAGASATIGVKNTIVTDTDSTAAPVLTPCTTFNGGTITDNGGNLEYPTTSCPFTTHADPKLNPLALTNGTYAFSLQPSSPALELGGTSCPATDQHDKVRPDGDACDSGSKEANLPETTASGPSQPTSSPQVTFSSDEPGSSFQCRVDGGAFSACTSPYSPAGLGDGSHAVDVRAISPAGYVDPSPASVTFTVDTTPPVVTIDPVESPTDDPNVEVTFSSSEPGGTFTCQVDSGPQSPCTSPYTTQHLSDGSHTITVRASDAAGNVGSASVDVVVITHPPDTAITSGPTGTIYTPSATFEFTASPPEGATFECRLDAGAWSTCTSPKTVSGYAPGSHTFSVRATGPTGLTDPSPPSRTFVYKKCIIGPIPAGGIGTVCI